MTERIKETTCTALEFTCNLCVAKPAFKSAKALASHQRVKHNMRNPLGVFLDSSGICPVCGANFHNRVRVLAH
eukprot:6040763-Karenia_brevis.AAC.1